MSIERSQAPVAQKSCEPQPNKTKNPADAENAPGGFAAVMEAQEAPSREPKRPENAAKAEATEKTAEKTAENRVESRDDDEDGDQTSSASKDDGTVSAQDAATALALLAAYLQGSTPAASAKSGASGLGGADGQTLAGVKGLVNGKDPGAEATLADAAKRLPGGAAFSADAARAAQADAKSGASGLANYASVLEQLKSRLAKGEMPVDDGGLKGMGVDTGATAAKSAPGLAVQNARMDKLMAAMQAGSGQAPVVDAAKLASLPAEAGEAMKAMDRLRGEAPRGATSNAADGAFGQHGFTPTVQFDGTAVSATVAGQSTGDAVADQVSYWVSQGVQNASLTLDGANAERVEVKISMTGNEAHVEFRSDQAVTREMLAGTAAHLKDLLSSQGVVLSGVTVGHAGADFTSGGQSQQSRPREGQGSPRGNVNEVRAVTAATPAAAKAPAGALDLFV